MFEVQEKIKDNAVRNFLHFITKMNGETYAAICRDIQVWTASQNIDPGKTIVKAVDAFFEPSKMASQKPLTKNEKEIISYIDRFILSFADDFTRRFDEFIRYVETLDKALAVRGIIRSDTRILPSADDLLHAKILERPLLNNLGEHKHLTAYNSPVAVEFKFEIFSHLQSAVHKGVVLFSELSFSGKTSIAFDFCKWLCKENKSLESPFNTIYWLQLDQKDTRFDFERFKRDFLQFVGGKHFDYEVARHRHLIVIVGLTKQNLDRFRSFTSLFNREKMYRTRFLVLTDDPACLSEDFSLKEIIITGLPEPSIREMLINSGIQTDVVEIAKKLKENLQGNVYLIKKFIDEYSGTDTVEDIVNRVVRTDIEKETSVLKKSYGKKFELLEEIEDLEMQSAAKSVLAELQYYKKGLDRLILREILKMEDTLFSSAVVMLADLRLIIGENVSGGKVLRVNPLLKIYMSEMTEFIYLEKKDLLQRADFFIEYTKDIGYCWNNPVKLKKLEVPGIRSAIEQILADLRANNEHERLIALSWKVRYYYYVKGAWNSPFNEWASESARRIGDAAREFETLMYHTNILLKRKMQDEVDKTFAELNDLDGLHGITTGNHKLRHDYYHLQALYAMNQQNYPAGIKIWRESLGTTELTEAQRNVFQRYLGKCFVLCDDVAAAKELFEKTYSDAVSNNFLRGQLFSKTSLLEMEYESSTVSENFIRTIDDLLRKSSDETIGDSESEARLYRLKGLFFKNTDKKLALSSLRNSLDRYRLISIERSDQLNAEIQSLLNDK